MKKRHARTYSKPPKIINNLAINLISLLIILTSLFAVFTLLINRPQQPEIFQATPDISITGYQDIEYKSDSTFTVAPGESWVIKPSPTCSENTSAEWLTKRNTGTTAVTVTSEPGCRKYLCHGFCPDFHWHHNDVSFGGTYGAGTTIIVSDYAILDDDVDTRINRILLNGNVVKECIQGLVAPSCRYTLKNNESGTITIDFVDSVGIDANPYVVVPTPYCETLSNQPTNLSRGTSATFSCNSNPNSGFTANFRILLDGEDTGSGTSGIFINSQGSANWPHTIDPSGPEGSYQVQCQVCNSISQCSPWGVAQANPN